MIYRRLLNRFTSQTQTKVVPQNLAFLLQRQTYSFSETPQKGNPSHEQQQTLTSEQKQKIRKYEIDEGFNFIAGVELNHNFQKQLILSQQRYQNNLKQLKQAILFKDLLSKQINILIYDTKGKPYYLLLLKTIYLMLVAFGSIYFIRVAAEETPQFKLFIYDTEQGQFVRNTVKVVAFFMMWVVFLRFVRKSRRYVEKVTYNTETENFTFTMRPWFVKSHCEVSRYKILYTENAHLNKKGTNYLNIETKDQYFIGYKNAWVKEDLFSHLIAQRIKL